MYKPMRDLSKMADDGLEGDGRRGAHQGGDSDGARSARLARRATGAAFKGEVEFDRVTFGYRMNAPC